MAKRLNVVVTMCLDCPHAKEAYDWLCGASGDREISEVWNIPDWCPLPDDVSKKDVPPKDNGE